MASNLGVYLTCPLLEKLDAVDPLETVLLHMIHDEGRRPSRFLRAIYPDASDQDLLEIEDGASVMLCEVGALLLEKFGLEEHERRMIDAAYDWTYGHRDEEDDK